MNANTNIKQGYKQTSLGILPQEWEVVRLGDICEIYQPQTIPQSDFTKEGYNVYGANVGFLQVGSLIGMKLAEIGNDFLIIAIGALIGYFVVVAEIGRAHV